ncbi:MAG: hypothetical protein NZ805_01105 [Armatimonadetes bacterium]|nr:hypothetical protein [Armatimonadota bacterium]MDW8027490.1 hypothetical protein [Armatimonadota bacterium]
MFRLMAYGKASRFALLLSEWTLPLQSPGQADEASLFDGIESKYPFRPNLSVCDSTIGDDLFELALQWLSPHADLEYGHKGG